MRLVRRTLFACVACMSLSTVLATPALARAGRLSSGEPLDVSIGRVLIALVICIIIAFLAVLLIRQRSGKIDLATLFSRVELRQRAIHVVETRRLSPNADLCLVRHDGDEYLLLLLAGNARVLRKGPYPKILEPGSIVQ